MRKKHNSSLIISKRVYSFAEIAKTLKVHIRTVQFWHKQGLPVIDNGKRPYLVMGVDLKKFLQARIQLQKCPLNPGELYCLKCRTGRKPCPTSIEGVYTGRKIGSGGTQVIIYGRCEVCGISMTRFSTSKAERICADRKAGARINSNNNPLSIH